MYSTFCFSLIFVDIRYMQYLVTIEIQLFFALLLLSHCVRESGTNPLLQLKIYVKLTIRILKKNIWQKILRKCGISLLCIYEFLAFTAVIYLSAHREENPG